MSIDVQNCQSIMIISFLLQIQFYGVYRFRVVLRGQRGWQAVGAALTKPNIRTVTKMQEETFQVQKRYDERTKEKETF